MGPGTAARAKAAAASASRGPLLADSDGSDSDDLESLLHTANNIGNRGGCRPPGAHPLRPRRVEAQPHKPQFSEPSNKFDTFSPWSSDFPDTSQECGEQ